MSCLYDRKVNLITIGYIKSESCLYGRCLNIPGLISFLIGLVNLPNKKYLKNKKDFMKNIVSYAFFGLVFLMVTACSSIEHPVITKESVTSRENTLVVMGVKWVETYNNPKEKTIKTLHSHQLLEDEELVKKRLIQVGKSELKGELYYLSHFNFYLADENGNTHTFEHFARDLRGYDPLVVYQFMPGKLTLDKIMTKHKKYTSHREFSKIELWKPYNVIHSQDYGSWQLPKGKIVYLGDLTLHFKTKRFIYGMIQEKVINRSVTLLKVTMEDRFEEARTALKENKPWFPADQMENLSHAQEWIFDQEAIEELKETETENEEKLKADQPEKKKEDSFF